MTALEGSIATDWADWLARWDRQQERYVPGRERRFDAMLAAVGCLGEQPLRVADLGSGPGCLAERLLARRPDDEVLAVDVDPVLITIGQRALASLPGLRWVEHDLREPGLPEVLGGTVDVVCATTALHWLTAGQLANLYAQVAASLRPGGLFLNGDHLDRGSGRDALRPLLGAVGAAPGASEGETWDEWWRAVGDEPALRSEVRDRDRLWGAEPSTDLLVPVELHEQLLLAAGFTTAGVIWQEGHDTLVAAVR